MITKIRFASKCRLYSRLLICAFATNAFRAAVGLVDTTVPSADTFSSASPTTSTPNVFCVKCGESGGMDNVIKPVLDSTSKYPKLLNSVVRLVKPYWVKEERREGHLSEK